MPAVTVATGGGGGDETGSGVAAAASAQPAERPERRVWLALKKHIIRERQRKKEEHEAVIEEERIRKEREARERQDVMTLGETREQIQQLEQKLTKLKEEKHQLFLQLKKVLNEDDNRKRQFKDTNDAMVNNMNGMVQGGAQIFLPPIVSQGGNQNMGRPPLSAHMLNKSGGGGGGGGGMKRGRSPSPPYVQPQSGPHTSSPYMHHPHHKQQHTTPYQGPTHKIEDGRNREMTRAVLWNKSSQHSSAYGSGYGFANTSSTSFYAMPKEQQRPGSVMYAPPVYHHHIQPHTPPKQIQSAPYRVEIKHDIKIEPPIMIGLGDPHQPSYLSQPPPGIPPLQASVPPPPLPASPVSGIRHPTHQQLMSVPPPPIHQGALKPEMMAPYTVRPPPPPPNPPGPNPIGVVYQNRRY